MRTPAFQQFAAQCEELLSIARQHPLADYDGGMPRFNPETDLIEDEDEYIRQANDCDRRRDEYKFKVTPYLVVQALSQAERHARLLQTLWEWAQSVTHDEPLAEQIVKGVDEAKAHVRELLQPHAETT